MENRIIYSDEFGNEIRFSSVREWNGIAKFSGMSAKYVLQGVEYYQINQKKYMVRSGEYLIGNEKTESEVTIQSDVNVVGLCIDISEALVRETCSKFNLDSDFYDFLIQQQLIVNKYNQSNTILGKKLEDLAKVIQNKQQYQFNLNLFEQLSYSLIEDQIQIYQKIGRLKFKKQFTQKEVFIQLISAKDFIDKNWNKSLDLNSIAHEAHMSKFHFARLFKDVIGLSPYQYLISVKMTKALAFLKENQTVQSVSEILNYPDISSFSKAFSKHYGIPPSLHEKIA
jgi:AraC family transcriptional regulator